MATNLPISSSGVRMRSENRTRQVGRFRTMAAQLIEEGDTESAAYLYRCADRFEQDDSDDEAPVEGLDDGAVHNLAADNELVGAFNRLAQVDDFDRGAFEGAEGILTNEGSFNMMQSVGRLNALSHDRVLDPTALDSVLDGSIDIADAYIQNAIEPVSIELPEVYAPQGVIAPVFVNDGLFDLNNSDGSEDELPSKLRRFDLNASDSSDEDLLEVPNVGRICMLQGSSSSIHPDDNLITSEEHQSWLQHLRLEHGSCEGFTSDDFKVWRLARRRALRRRALDDQHDKPDELPVSLPLDHDNAAPEQLRITPPPDVVMHANMRSSGDPRFLYAVTPSLFKSGTAPTGHVGQVFEVGVVLKDRVRVTLLAEARGPAHTLLIEIPFSELWRCVILEMELPFNVVPLVGENIASWIPMPASVQATAALMHLRRHLVDLWLDGKAGGLILRGSPPPRASVCWSPQHDVLRSPQHAVLRIQSWHCRVPR